MSIIELIKEVKEVKQSIERVEPLLMEYSGTVMGESLAKLIAFCDDIISEIEEKLGGEV